ncbi:hypothetical protein AM1_A0278 (plasmid) [Acaryochloris marina MBIC11017]|uniref:Uncharacterized protein n=1 Tax=Acaryochloris marina (strain MBIC 11017) TaxID=329726 RepID=A8ZKS8_ACAM1|nr:hypothetical protein AM1_A0278 [Acaryochloris marina MBIC11017]
MILIPDLWPKIGIKMLFEYQILAVYCFARISRSEDFDDLV